MPFDEWVADFRISRNRYQIDAQYYAGGVPDNHRDRHSSERPTASVRAVLDGSGSGSTPANADGLPSVPVRLSGSPRSSPPEGLNADTATTGAAVVGLDHVPDTVARFMSWIDSEYDFTAFPVPPLRSPAAHTRLQRMETDYETHAQTVVERLSPPVEALVPLESGHRVLAVESLSDVTGRGDPDDATTWDRYRDQLRPGECLGVHLTEARGRALEMLREWGFNRAATNIPNVDVADARKNVLHCWLHAPDIGRVHGLVGRVSAVVMALPRPYTLVGSFTVAPDGTRLTYETEMMVKYDAYRAALAAAPTALAPTHPPDTLLGTG